MAMAGARLQQRRHGGTAGLAPAAARQGEVTHVALEAHLALLEALLGGALVGGEGGPLLRVGLRRGDALDVRDAVEAVIHEVRQVVQ